MPIKNKDFIEAEYTGKVKDDDFIFDTTDEESAKDNDILNPNVDYGSVIVCVGEGHLLKGIENYLVGKEPGKYHIDLNPEVAFGKKNPKLLKLVPTSVFRKQNIMPQPGLQVNIDGVLGTLRTVSGGRCTVDFNHPLSGKEVTYDLNVHRIVTDVKEKIASLVKLQLGVKKEDLTIEEKEGTATINFDKKVDLNDEIKKTISDKIIELTNIKKIVFANKKE